MAYGHSVTVQRRQHSGNLKVLLMDQQINSRTGSPAVVGARDAYASKKKTGNKTIIQNKVLQMLAIYCANFKTDISNMASGVKTSSSCWRF